MLDNKTVAVLRPGDAVVAKVDVRQGTITLPCERNRPCMF